MIIAYREKVAKTPSTFKAVSGDHSVSKSSGGLKILSIPKQIALDTNAFLAYLGFEPFSESELERIKKSFGLTPKP